MSLSCHHINDVYLVSKKQTRKQFRRSILEAWDWQCAYCGSCVKEEPTLDHVKPLSQGGLTSKENLVAACISCNFSKGDSRLEVWYRQQLFYSWKKELEIQWWRIFQKHTFVAFAKHS